MSEKRSFHNSYEMKKQTVSSTTKTKLQLRMSHMDRHLPGNRSAQNLNLSTQVFLSSIVSQMTTSILQLLNDKAHKNRRAQRALDNKPELSRHFKVDTNSQVDETLKSNKNC